VQLDENFIWQSEANMYILSEQATDMLALKFPELIRANGTVDSSEAIVTLLDRIAELSERVNQLGD
jgi:hypothetical protein